MHLLVIPGFPGPLCGAGQSCGLSFFAPICYCCLLKFLSMLGTFAECTLLLFLCSEPGCTSGWFPGCGGSIISISLPLCMHWGACLIPFTMGSISLCPPFLIYLLCRICQSAYLNP
ncbi:hypothetical protein B0H17DRAFT_402849 [Mycena rosella]|uniref:Uncharacterized protein n=1 Tax=Mycena rosella TaxID=1033263 RepID=A0AAD7GMX0_MYCRO|nr:hypothetical protein B0H17DRAFT_402849 [Mycena rosella]